MRDRKWADALVRKLDDEPSSAAVSGMIETRRLCPKPDTAAEYRNDTYPGPLVRQYGLPRSASKRSLCLSSRIDSPMRPDVGSTRTVAQSRGRRSIESSRPRRYWVDAERQRTDASLLEKISAFISIASQHLHNLGCNIRVVDRRKKGENKANTMRSAAALRSEIEAALSQRIPSALTTAAKTIRECFPTGNAAVDVVLNGGFPVGAVTEMVGPEGSGRTALALSFVAHVTKANRVCAWIDVSNTLSPESAAASGVDLKRLLWVRCGVGKIDSKSEPSSPDRFILPEKLFVPQPVKRGLHGGGFGPHPRSEAKGLSDGVSGLLRADAIAPRCAEPQRRVRAEREVFEPVVSKPHVRRNFSAAVIKPWSRIEQALRATDLLLQAGGFSAVVLDLGSIAHTAGNLVSLQCGCGAKQVERDPVDATYLLEEQRWTRPEVASGTGAR